MKKFILASLIAVLALSCKKEDPAPPTTPTTPAGPTNYIIVNGDGHNNDTVLLDTSLYGRYLPSSGVFTVLHGASTQTPDQINLTVQCSAGGAFSVLQPYPQWQISSMYVGGVVYSSPNLSLTIGYYGAVGDLIQSNYSGTFKKQSDTTVVISVSGNFNVVRGNDM